MNVIQFADKHFTDYQTKGDEIIPDICPFCKGGSTGKDKKTFALNINTGVYNCKRGTCGVKGTFWSLLNEFGELKKRNKYRKPKKAGKKLTDKWVKYFKGRGISKETLENRKVLTVNNAVAFPYYENGECVAIKYRTEDKKMWREKRDKPVLWGMDGCRLDKPLIIVEGEIDALTLDECEIENVVSIPSGTEELEWINICYDWLGLFEEIILWFDNDEPGEKCTKTVADRLGEEKIKVVNSKYKDANEVLVNESKEEVKELIQQAEELPIDGVVELTQIKEEKLSPEDITKTNIKKLDKYVAGLIRGKATIIVAESESGKSLFSTQMCAEAADQGKKSCIFSGELKPKWVRRWLFRQIAGPNHLEIKEHEDRPDEYWIPKNIWAKLNDYYHGMFFVYDCDMLPTSDILIKTFTTLYKRYGIELFVVDNMGTTALEGTSGSKYDQQGKFVLKMKAFAKQHNVHVIIVHHTRKDSNDEKDDIKGSGDIQNFSDTVFNLKRIRDKEELSYDTALNILKDREFGNSGKSIGLMFNKPSQRFYDRASDEQAYKKYRWERVNETDNWYF